LLEGRGVIGSEAHVRQAHESGRHPVDDRSCLDGRCDDLPSGIDPPQDVFAQGRPGTPHNPDDILNPERADQFHRCRRIRHPSIASDDLPRASLL
jgi:hypothetical protein